MRASPRRPESSCRADRPRSIGCGEHGLAHEPHIAALLARGILVRSISARARCVYRTARSAAPRTRCTCATSRSEADSRCCSVSRSACSVRLLGRAARGAASSTGHAFDDGEATHAARCESAASAPSGRAHGESHRPRRPCRWPKKNAAIGRIDRITRLRRSQCRARRGAARGAVARSQRRRGALTRCVRGYVDHVLW